MLISVRDHYYSNDMDKNRFNNTCLNTEKSDEILKNNREDWYKLFKYYWSPKFNPETHFWNDIIEEVCIKKW